MKQYDFVNFNDLACNAVNFLDAASLRYPSARLYITR